VAFSMNLASRMCKSGLECNSAEPGKAGVCANATVPEQVVPTTPQTSVNFRQRRRG
jgi:hypothetical protein